MCQEAFRAVREKETGGKKKMVRLEAAGHLLCRPVRGGRTRGLSLVPGCFSLTGFDSGLFS